MVQENWKSDMKQNVKLLALWTFLWVASMALASFGPKFIWDGNQTFNILAVGLNALMGIGMIWMNIKYLSGLDEMQKKIQLDAMALALGVGVIGGLNYSLLDVTNLITGDAEISVLVIIISITYMAGILIGQKRYK